METLYTINEVTDMLKVTRAAVYKWMAAGQLDYVTIGTLRRVPKSALDAFIMHRSGPSPKDQAGTLAQLSPA